MVRYRRGSFLPDQHFSSLFLFFVKWGIVGFVNTTSLSLEKSWKGWEENRHKQLLRNLKRTLKQLFQCLTLDFQTLRRKVEAAFKLTVFLRVVARQRRMVMVVVMKQTIWRHKRMMEAKAKVMYSHANQLEQLLSFYSILMIVVVIMVILVIRIMTIVLVVVIILIVLVMVIMVMYSHASQR